MFEKRKNGAEYIRGIKIETWIKYKDLMSECHGTKILLKGTMIVFKTKGPQVRRIPHGSFGLSQCKSSSKKTCWLTKSKDGRWGLAQTTK